jgi:hypothetical protein
MGTPRWPLRGRPYTDAQIRELLARLPDTPFVYRELARAVTEAGLAEGRGLPVVVANGVRTSLLTRGLLRPIPSEKATLLQKVPQ